MTVSDFRHAHKISQRFKYRKEFVFEHQEGHGGPRHEKPIFLHYGMPHDGFFPIDSMVLKTVDKPFQTYYDKNAALKEITIPRTRESMDQMDISESLQYGDDIGMPKTQKILKELVLKMHPPAFSKWDTVVSFGTGDAVYKVFDLLLDPGDSVLVEEFTFVPTLSSITCFGAELYPVKLDLTKDGLDAADLEHKLTNWQTLYPGKKFPKCVYTIPSGHNPTGATQSLGTRKRIYELCDKHDVIIVEDDPYGCLALAKYNQLNPFDDDLSVDDFIKNYVPTSYLEIDKSARVIRMESFSKIFAPGIRLGSITAHEVFVKKIKLFIAISTKQPSGASQALLCSVYDHMNGFEGWVRWLIKVSSEYTVRKQTFMSEILNSKLAAVDNKLRILEPMHGMFVTVQFNFKPGTDVVNALNHLEKIGLEHGVVFVLGTRLSADEESSKLANFARIALSPVENSKELIEGARRFIKTAEIYFEKFEN